MKTAAKRVRTETKQVRTEAKPMREESKCEEPRDDRCKGSQVSDDGGDSGSEGEEFSRHQGRYKHAHSQEARSVKMVVPCPSTVSPVNTPRSPSHMTSATESAV